MPGEELSCTNTGSEAHCGSSSGTKCVLMCGIPASSPACRSEQGFMLNISPVLWGICMYVWQEFLAVLHRKGNFCQSFWMGRKLEGFRDHLGGEIVVPKQIGLEKGWWSGGSSEVVQAWAAIT